MAKTTAFAALLFNLIAIVISNSIWYGGSGLNNDLKEYSFKSDQAYITGICINAAYEPMIKDKIIHGIGTITFSDLTKLPQIGGTKSSPHNTTCYQVNYGECFKGVFIRSYQFIDALQFITTDNQVSKYWGGKGGIVSYYTGNRTPCLTRINIKYHDFIDGIQFEFNEIKYDHLLLGM